jgi:hypothetical protein
MTQPCYGARAGRSRPGRHSGAFRAVGLRVPGPREPPVRRTWSSDIPGMAIATEPTLPACGGGRAVPSGFGGACGAARQH